MHLHIFISIYSYIFLYYLTLCCSSVDCIALVALVSMTEKGLARAAICLCPGECCMVGAGLRLRRHREPTSL